LIRGDRPRRLLRLYLGWLLGATVRSYLDPYAASDAAVEVENISAACLMLRRKAIAEIGLLDENFFMYFEDIDYCIRLQDAGWKLYYLPASEIVHLVGQSSGGRMRNYSTHSYHSLFYFYHKHYPASSLRMGKRIVLSLSAARWLWNLVLSWISDSSVYVRNRQDLESIIRLCWEHPMLVSNRKTPGQAKPAPQNIRETVSISGGNE
jgi:GT2 family glycosyltransferase